MDGSLRVLGVSGGPRSGATSRLVRAALRGAEEVAGVTTELVELGGLRISPCNGCIPCLEAGHCVINDDIQPLYEPMLRADALHMSGRTIPALGIAWMYGRKVATVARILRAGVEATGLDLPDGPYGFELPDSFPADVLHFES